MKKYGYHFLFIALLHILFLGDCFAQTQQGMDIDGDGANHYAGVVSMPDANTIAVGAPINTSEILNNPGYVRVFTWDGDAWVQLGLNIVGEANRDQFGFSVSMPNSTTLAVGALGNDGTAIDAGHARVFTWDGTAWIQKGMDIDGLNLGDQLGTTISMPDENTVAVGAVREDVGGSNSGSVHIFEWDGNNWVQKGTTIGGVATEDLFGSSLSMPDANTVAVGAASNDGNGNSSGEVRVFEWNGSGWMQKGADLNGEAAIDRFGQSVSMPDANHLAVGAMYNSNNGEDAGHVKMFEWDGDSWIQKGNSIEGTAGEQLGYSVSAPTPDVIAVGSNANSDNGEYAGQVKIYEWNNNSWIQKGVAIDGESAGDTFGSFISMPTPGVFAGGSKINNGGGSRSGHARVFTFCSAPSTGIDTQTACDAYTWIDGNTYFSSTNTPTWTLSNALGCDSIVTLDLTMNYSSTGTDVQSACDSYTWIDGNTYTATTNSPSWILTNSVGCDSLVTLDLTIGSSSTGVDVQTACNTYTWIDGNTYTSSTNSPSWILTNSVGCDSLVTLDLTISNETTGIDVQSACDTYTWIDGTTYTSTTNTPSWTLTNAAGCDSLVTLNLTINSSSFGIDVQSACDTYTWIDGNTYTSSDNSATHTLINAAGCDSIVTLNLTINTVSASVSQDGAILSADENGASYQWLNCPELTPVDGATEQTYMATENGDYAVLVNNNGCSETSDCLTVTITGIIENDFGPGLLLYPNPTVGDFSIDLGEDSQFAKITITDLRGKVLMSKSYNDQSILNMELDEPAGIYLVRIESDGKKAVVRLVKE